VASLNFFTVADLSTEPYCSADTVNLVSLKYVLSNFRNRIAMKNIISSSEGVRTETW